MGEDLFVEVRDTFDYLEFGLEKIESCDRRWWQTYAVGRRVCEEVMCRNSDKPIFHQEAQCYGSHI